MSLRYKANPIRSLTVLAVALGVSEQDLLRLSNRADDLYRKAKPIMKPDGSFRQPLDALPQLKHVHKRIKERLLVNVHFPTYLVFQLERKFEQGARGPELFEELNRTTNRVGRLGQFHSQEAMKLKERLKKIRRLLDIEPVMTAPCAHIVVVTEASADDVAPWN